jgi:hypothetical protein
MAMQRYVRSWVNSGHAQATLMTSTGCAYCRSKTARIWAADQLPPRGAQMPWALRPNAIERSDVAPLAWRDWIVGIKSLARCLAFADRTARALQVPARPRNPPRTVPRAFAAPNAARVRSEIIRASCSATAARIWIVNRFADGKSTASNSTPASIRLETKATLRASRSNLAITRVAL